MSLLHNVEGKNLVKQKKTIEEYTFSLLMGIKVMQEPKYAVKMKKKSFFVSHQECTSSRTFLHLQDSNGLGKKTSDVSSEQNICIIILFQPCFAEMFKNIL